MFQKYANAIEKYINLKIIQFTFFSNVMLFSEPGFYCNLYSII